MTDEHKEDDSIKGELGEVIREFRHVFERRTSTGSGLFFFKFWTVVLPKGSVWRICMWILVLKGLK